MFVYGYAYNVTNWAASKKPDQPDPYIKALIEKTVLHQLTLSPTGCTATVSFKLGLLVLWPNPLTSSPLARG
jgi:hypothetical protein